MGSDIHFTPAQQCAIENRGGSLLVSAAAGSGKTRVLVERVLSRLETEPDCSVTDFLIITYTRAAAAELKGRIADGIARRSAEMPENAFLRRQTALAAKAEIGTIHSFCGNLLRRYSYLTELPPDFAVLEENGAELLRREVLEEVLEKRYSVMTEGDSFSALVEGLAAGRRDDRLIEILLETYVKIQSNVDPRGWIREQKNRLLPDRGTDIGETLCGRYLLQRMEKTVRYQRYLLCALWEEMEAAPDFMAKYGASVKTSMEGLANLQKALQKGWDKARNAALAVQWPRCSPCKGYDDLKNRRKEIKKQCDKITEKMNLTSGDAAEDAAAVAPMLEGLYDAVLDFDEAYGQAKKKRGVADFSDLEHMALRLLVNMETGERTEVAKETAKLYREIMVDEYQDVNRVQDAIFRAVSRNGENIFMVGDVKQSIYRFRLADPAIFLAKYKEALPAEKAKEGTMRKVLLQQNFRSRTGILDACNFVFRNVMSESFGEMDYTSDEALYPGAGYAPTEEPAMELDVLDRSDGEEGESREKTEAEAEFIARRIRNLMGTFRVAVSEEESRPLRYGDIAVLLRSPGHVRRRYEEIFAAYGIPVGGDSRGSFLETIEISDMLAVLSVIDNPHQDVELATVLMSPLFGFTADELANIRIAGPKEDFYGALCLRAESDDHCREFLDWLKHRREEAADQTVAAILQRIYDSTGALGLYGAMPGGSDRRENLQSLLENAFSFAQGESRSLFSFVHSLREMTEIGREPLLPAGAGGGDAVSLMSIHKSKGLEYPVVILAGLSGKINTVDTTRPLLIHSRLGAGPKRVDTERKIEFETLPRMAIAAAIRDETWAEELRVLYVAMTRAREKLICVVSFADPEKELTARLSKVSRLPIDPGALLETQCMADWILLPALCRREASSLRFGAPPPALWNETDSPWDIRLISETQGTIQAAPAYRKEEKAEPVDFSMLSYTYPYSDRAEIPSKVTATELKGRFADDEAGEEAEKLAHRMPLFRQADFAPEKALSGAEKGTALHLVMQYIRFENCHSLEDIEGEILCLAEKKIISEKQAAAVSAGKILAFFQSSVGREMLISGKISREMKFSVLVPSESLHYPPGEEIMLQGVIDCFFETEQGITVLDFKTDFVTAETVAERAEQYRSQLNAYKTALERITGKPVCRRILYFFSIGSTYEL